MNPNLAILLGLLPAVMLAGGALVCAALALVRPGTRTSLYRWITLLSTVAAFVASMLELTAMTHDATGVGAVDYQGGLIIDRFHVFGTVLVCGVVALTVLGAQAYLRRAAGRAGAFCALLLLSAAASSMLLAQREMAAFTVDFALLIACLVLLTAMTKTSGVTAEAAFRQVLSGGVALATAVYGLVLVYAATGTTDLSRLATGLRVDGTRVDPVLAVVGIGLVIVGLLIVVGAPPLQAWTRHIQEAAPGPIAGFSSALGVVTGVAVLSRYGVEGFGAGSSRWTVLVDVLAAVAMLSGGVLAIRASTIRRLIADLSIVQAGFLLLAAGATAKTISGQAAAGPTALLYALMAAATSLVAALLLAGIFDAAGLGTGLEAYRGAGRRSPTTAGFLALALLALAGLPPLAGFIARLLIAETALDAGAGWAVAAAAVATTLSGVALFRWLSVMYAEDENESPFAVTTTPLVSRVTAWTAAVLGLLLAAFAGPLLSIAGGGATALH
ncbi:MAG TPA: proton-conducting transporter membrane subunit [Candidatus Dormibacteraeota bacterium]|nr:proton-conducting transporter membrane subunit [Candidatus Dormibacteraeota bacterium]